MAFLDFFKSVDINNEVNRCRTTKGSVLLDVRTEEEYRSGHISGSRNIPVEKIDNAVNLLHDKSAPLFVYCQSGARSRKAVSKLRKMGYTEVYNIGGIDSFQGQLQRGKR
jgi:rhodanese-related sulfurtransferase